MSKKSTEWNISWKRTCGKTTAKMENNTRRHSSFLLNIRGWRRLGEDRDTRRANY